MSLDIGHCSDTVTTIRVIVMSNTSQSFLSSCVLCVYLYFCEKNTLYGTYYLKFWSEQDTIINHRHQIVQHISRTYSSYINEIYAHCITPHFPLPCSLWQPLIVFSASMSMIFLDTSCNWSYLSFCDCLISLRIMSSGVIHVVTNSRIFFFFNIEKQSACIYFIISTG